MKLVYEAKEFVPHASVDRKDRRSVHMFMAVAFGANVFAGITDVIQHAYTILFIPLIMVAMLGIYYRLLEQGKLPGFAVGYQRFTVRFISDSYTVPVFSSMDASIECAVKWRLHGFRLVKTMAIRPVETLYIVGGAFQVGSFSRLVGEAQMFQERLEQVFLLKNNRAWRLLKRDKVEKPEFSKGILIWSVPWSPVAAKAVAESLTTWTAADQLMRRGLASTWEDACILASLNS